MITQKLTGVAVPVESHQDLQSLIREGHSSFKHLLGRLSATSIRIAVLVPEPVRSTAAGDETLPVQSCAVLPKNEHVALNFTALMDECLSIGEWYRKFANTAARPDHRSTHRVTCQFS